MTKITPNEYSITVNNPEEWKQVLELGLIDFGYITHEFERFSYPTNLFIRQGVMECFGRSDIKYTAEEFIEEFSQEGEEEIGEEHGALMTDQEILAVVKAHSEGKTIQFMTLGVGEWCDTDRPMWNFAVAKYRVKPPEAVWVNLYKPTNSKPHAYVYESEALANDHAGRSRLACVKITLPEEAE